MILFKRHFLPLFLAICFCYFFVHFSNYKRTPYHDLTLSGQGNRLVAVAHDSTAERKIVRAIENDFLIVLGSSELSNSTHKYIPYNFFPDAGINTLAIGNAGHQSFLMMAQLMPYYEKLANKKLVILISPTWFNEYADGTHPENFSKYISLTKLYQIYSNTNLPDKYKLAMGDYLQTNKHHFGNYNNIISAFCTKSEFYKRPYNPVNSICYGFLDFYCKQAVNHKEVSYTHRTYTAFPKLPEFNWSQLMEVQKDTFLKQCTNNSFYVYNDYYTNYIKDVDLKQSMPFSYKNTQEWSDFLCMLDFFKSSKANVFFVMQPLNPHFYKSIDVYKGLVKQINTEIKKRNMPLLDLFVFDKTKYTPGTLCDIMHLGELGWLKIDSALIKHYGR